MFCGKCGSKITKSDKFCKKCGQPVKEKSAEIKTNYIPNSNKQKPTVMALCGFIFGIISMLVTRIVYALIGIEDFVNEKNIIIYVILGIIIGILLIVGLIISLIDYLKTRNVFSLMGILLNGLALTYGIMCAVSIIVIMLD